MTNTEISWVGQWSTAVDHVTIKWSSRDTLANIPSGLHNVKYFTRKIFGLHNVKYFTNQIFHKQYIWAPQCQILHKTDICPSHRQIFHNRNIWRQIMHNDIVWRQIFNKRNVWRRKEKAALQVRSSLSGAFYCE